MSTYQGPPSFEPPNPGPQQWAPPPAPAQKKKLRSRWWFWAAIALVVVVIIAALNSPDTDERNTVASVDSTDSTRADQPERTRESQPERTTTPRTTAAPRTTTVPAPPPVPPAAVYSGSGDDVVAIVKPTTGAVLAAITGNDAGRYFGVKGLDGGEDTLVNTTEAYVGTTLMDLRGGETTQLQVTAEGPWTITLNSVATATRFTTTFSGAGDGVIIYDGLAGVAEITGNDASSYFGVSVYSDTESDNLVNTTEAYSGRVPIPAGIVLVAFTATGPWTITVT